MSTQNSRAKQLIILSGKGGTGKTSISAAFAHLNAAQANSRPMVFVDADVDAANLSLVLQPDSLSPNEFWGGSLAEIDPAKCINCGACSPVCRYDAIFPDPKMTRYSGSTQLPVMVAARACTPAQQAPSAWSGSRRATGFSQILPMACCFMPNSSRGGKIPANW